MTGDAPAPEYGGLTWPASNPVFIDGGKPTNLNAVSSKLIVNLIPVMTAVIAFYVLNEEITIYKVLGIVIVISGIFLVQYKRISHL